MAENNNNIPEKRIYKPVPNFAQEEISAAMQQDNVESLIYIAFAVGYYCDDWKYAQDICIRLSDHPNKTVRGNAILGLFYVAIFRRQLDKRLVKPILLRALRDPEQEVRERAEDAIPDINRAMKWKIAQYHKKEKTIGVEENTD
jgi:hypothetical protein